MVSVQFSKNFTGPPFVVGRPKNFKLLADISFESGLQNIALSSFTAVFACLLVDLDDIQ